MEEEKARLRAVAHQLQKEREARNGLCCNRSIGVEDD